MTIDQEKFADFISTLHQDVQRRSQELEGEEREEDLESEFTRRMSELLSDAGILYDGVVCYHKVPGAKVNGYNYNDIDSSLDLFVSVYKEKDPPANLTKDELESSFRRLSTFFKQALTGAHRAMNKSSEAKDLAMTIFETKGELSQVRFFLFTDGIVRTTYEDAPSDIDGMPVSYQIWDALKTFQTATSGEQLDKIEVDIEAQNGEPLMCIYRDASEAEYEAYLTAIPGSLLFAIYDNHGARLLERNVRAFLQVRGKVNKGIRDTILKEPDHFLAFNNGISATAESVEFEELGPNLRAIKSIKDLQIVNGGQTTASLFHAVKKDGADLSKVFVQAKISVVNPDKAAEMVPTISRCANSQNKINEADFHANDKFHVRLEELSRTIWAPALGMQRQTHWFYERARGQYLDAKGREATPARKREFEAVNPPDQKFTKTDLAKFENTWDLLPHLVSRGSEKNFSAFRLKLKERQIVYPDELYFRRLVAKAILFRRCDELVLATLGRGAGYKANVVTYAISYLCARTAAQIDLAPVWDKQALPSSIEEALVAIIRPVYEQLKAGAQGGNVTEFCKKDGCWDEIRALDITLPDLGTQLLSLKQMSLPAPRIAEELTDSDREVIGRIQKVTPNGWFSIASWAKETNNLQPWQRKLAFSMAQLAQRGAPPSRKQAVQAEIILEEASRKGFVYAEA